MHGFCCWMSVYQFSSDIVLINKRTSMRLKLVRSMKDDNGTELGEKPDMVELGVNCQRAYTFCSGAVYGVVVLRDREEGADIERRKPLEIDPKTRN
ncbi:hypothetical protein Fmac_001368 [Flemingia macrophylla]|uniref:Uncharacterized protein n=1 Tax=Flemingia macrophylla TaxID=520843 RepID=A0ABD1NGV9_9FABA